MKLAALLLGTILGASLFAPGTASADQLLQPPGGPVHVADEPPAPRPHRAGRRGRAERGPGAGELRRALLSTFDANGDGKLGPRERRHAARALRRIERRLATPDNAGVPRGGGRDRDRDRWVEPGE